MRHRRVVGMVRIGKPQDAGLCCLETWCIRRHHENLDARGLKGEPSRNRPVAEKKTSLTSVAMIVIVKGLHERYQ